MDLASTHSRRRFLGAAVGGAAAAVAAAAVPSVVRAADGANAVVGATNLSTTATIFQNTDTGEASLVGAQIGLGTGVAGESVDGTGVGGQSVNGVALKGASTQSTPTVDFTAPSHHTAVHGTTGPTTNASVNTDEAGVYGFADLSIASIGVWGESKTGTGVFGSGSFGVFGSGDFGVVGAGPVGVLGDVDSASVGVYGHTGEVAAPTPPPGVGVYARAATPSLTALSVSGKARFSRSGRTTLSATAVTRTIVMAGVTATSYIIATMQTDVPDVYVRSVVPTAGSFNIHLSKAAGKVVVVGYLVIN
jgi:hypothetical protein